jgi:AraC family transcriptional regulator, regulatory protein of adaptative response / DNA-3-methyladenine glycosylase II
METEQVMYRAISSRDRRFDGRFVLGVVTTGIYCRPSCPARTPLAQNVRYFAIPAAAVAAGFRACKRCRPDTVPGGRLWDHRGDLAARALRLVGAGAVDEGGVSGLAHQLSVSERHLHRTLVEEVGAGPLALARTRRAQTARMLLDQTDMSVTDVAFAAGFSSVRQFNDVMRAEFGTNPRTLRRTGDTPDRPAEPGSLVLRLAARTPFDGRRVAAFLASRAIPGVESVDDGYRRIVGTTVGPVDVHVSPQSESVRVELRLPDLAALKPAVAAVRRLFDLEADAAAIHDVLGADPALASLVHRRPGLRVPGSVSGFEIAVRAVVGQQISVAGARTLLGRIAERAGEVSEGPPTDEPRVVFPSPSQLAVADLAGLGLTTRRIATLQALAAAVAAGDLRLDTGVDRVRTREQLLAIPGIGPWTVEYVCLRALADPDAFPATDLVLGRITQSQNLDPDRWRPWRAYAAIHLWTEHAEESR